MRRPFRFALIVPLIVGPCLAISMNSPVRNRCVIDTVAFDTASHSIRLSWKIDSADFEAGLEASISVTCGRSVPVSPNGSFPVLSRKGDTTLTVPSLRFDTVYTIGIWCRVSGTWAPPDTSSLRVVKIPPATWEPVKLFPTADTIRILGNRVLLWHDADYGVNVPLHYDTVRIRPIDPKKMRGCIAAGLYVSFSNPVPTPPFFVALCYDSITGEALSKVRIFRDSSGLLLLEHDFGIDTVNRRVWVKTSRMRFPFLTLIDTAKPHLDLESDTGQTIDSTIPDLVFRVHDNTANVRVQLFSGSGDKSLFTGIPRFSKTLEDTSEKLTWQLSADGIRENGLRAYLTIRDGCANDTINISRQVVRRRCDERSTAAKAIMPIAATAELDDASPRSCLRTLFESANDEYDKKEFRLYRWFPEAGNETSDGWLEYASGRDSLFTFEVGRLFWLITREEKIFDFGRGRTPSLKDTFELSLEPKQWTDFSLPYGFDVGMDDIRRATGAGGDSLYFYQWIRDNDRNTFRAEAFSCPRFTVTDNILTAPALEKSGIYTVYNVTESRVVMRIPSVPSPLATAFPLFRSRSPAAWCFCITASGNGTPANRVYCAASEETKTPLYIPPPPAFSGLSVAIKPLGGAGKHGMVKVPYRNDSITLFEVMATNPLSTKQSLDCRAQRLSGKVEGIFTSGGSQRYLGGSASIEIDPRSTASRVFAVGTSGQIDRFVQALPDVQSGVREMEYLTYAKGLCVTYGPPMGTRSIMLHVIDMQGKQIAKARVTANGSRLQKIILPFKTGIHGCYIVKVSAITDKGSTVSEVRKMVLY